MYHRTAASRAGSRASGCADGWRFIQEPPTAFQSAAGVRISSQVSAWPPEGMSRQAVALHNALA